MTRDEANQILEPYYNRVAGCAVSGYERYRKYPRRSVHRRATRATLVNDEIIARVVQEFDGVAGTRMVEIRSANLRFLEIEGKILLWFKKVDRQRKFKLYPTPNADALEAGKQLSMFPDAVILVVGYMLNRDETKVARVSISKPAGRKTKLEWFIDLEIRAEVVVLEPKGSTEKTGPRVIVRLGEQQAEIGKS